MTTALLSRPVLEIVNEALVVGPLDIGEDPLDLDLEDYYTRSRLAARADAAEHRFVTAMWARVAARRATGHP
jgi:hypothetical protein